jgi:predicted flavoprotein YhiN
VQVFQKIFDRYRKNISLHFREGAEAVNSIGEVFRVQTKKGQYDADILIITTGGNAYAHTGSTGDGYTFARTLGHTLTPL